MNEPVPLRAPIPAGDLPAAQQVRVSVLVPAYNAAATIGHALESALAQTPPPHEVIVSDDGSVDDLQKALEPFADHIQVIRGPNGGLAVARNRAADVATGELLALLDADDVWLPGRLAAFEQAAGARSDLTIFTTDAVERRAGVLSAGTYYGTRAFAVTRQDLAILRSNFIFGAGAIRRDAFRAAGGYRAGVRYAEDWDLWIRLVLRGHRAGLIDLPLYEYRRRPESLTGQKVELALGVLDLLSDARSSALTPEQFRQVRLTEQEWRESAAHAAHTFGDPRVRSLALRAAAGCRATPRARLRFAGRALLPRRLVSALAGPR